MSKLKIYKVNSLPSTLEANALYFIKQTDNNKLILYVTDKNATIAYKSYDSTDIIDLINLIITTLTDEPSGLAGINSNGDITLVNESLNCYTIEQIAISDGEQIINLPQKINETNHNLYINGLKQPKSYTYSYLNDTITIPATFEIKISDIIMFEYYKGKIN